MVKGHHTIKVASPDLNIQQQTQNPQHLSTTIFKMTVTFTSTLEDTSLSVLFNNCVDYFQYLQFDQANHPPNQQFSLKFDLLACRLGRWGVAIRHRNIHQPLESFIQQDRLKEVQGRLELIFLKAKALHQESDIRQRMFPNKSFVRLAGTARTSGWEPLQNHLHIVTKERLDEESLTTKTACRIYEETCVDRIIKEITHYIDALERLNPKDVNNLARVLATEEIEKVQDPGLLTCIRTNAKEVDWVLHSEAIRKLQEWQPQSFLGEAKVHIGNHFAATDAFGSPLRSSNTVGIIDVQGGNVTIGNTYGGKGFWD